MIAMHPGDCLAGTGKKWKWEKWAEMAIGRPLVTIRQSMQDAKEYLLKNDYRQSFSDKPLNGADNSSVIGDIYHSSRNGAADQIPLQVLLPGSVREQLGIMAARERTSLRSLIIRAVDDGLGISEDEERRGLS